MFKNEYSASDVKNLFADKLTESNISLKDSKSLGLSALMPAKTKSLCNLELPSIKISYFDIESNSLNFYRLRILGDRAVDTPKYLQAPNTIPRLYFPTNIDWIAIIEDIERPIVFTEGEFKAIAASQAGFPTIALSGVWNWKCKSRHLSKLPEFDYLNLDGRDIYICFDSDMHTNPKVLQALYKFANMLTQLGAIIYIVELPQDDDEKIGIDDYLIKAGVEGFKEQLNIAQPYEPSKELYQLNSEVAYITKTNAVIVLKSKDLMTINDFKNGRYANRYYYEPQIKKDGNVNYKEKSASDGWIKWPHRYELNELVYIPNADKVINNNFNLWSGWGCEPKAGSVKPWKDLLDYFFKNDVLARNWFEQWCAYQFQYPGEKLYTAVGLWSVEQGTGKSLVGYTLIKIFGDNGGEVKQRDLHSAYNDWSVHKQFIMGDEITGSNKKADNDLIKGLITQQTITVNQKYVPIYSIRDTINYLFTSNHPDAFYMEDTDRRMFIHEIKGAPMSDDFYKIYDTWLNNEGASHLFYYFLNMNINDFNAKSRALVTESKKEMKIQTKSELGAWVFDILENGVYLGGIKLESEIYTPSQLTDIFNRKAKRQISSNAMGRELRRQGISQLPPINIKGKMLRLYAIKDTDKWNRRKNTAITKHYLKFNDK